jgi:ketosteroid isomerase-like protein
MTRNLKSLAAAALLIFGGCAQETAAPSNAAETATAPAAQDIVDTVYAGFAAGDIALAVSTMAPDIEWLEAEGNPYADKNPYVGADAIVSDLFARLGGEWDGFSAMPEEYVTEGGRVIVFGRYTGTYIATGKSMDAPFVHSWTVRDGKIVGFQQYTNTAAQVAAMTGDGE